MTLFNSGIKLQWCSFAVLDKGIVAGGYCYGNLGVVDMTRSKLSNCTRLANHLPKRARDGNLPVFFKPRYMDWEVTDSAIHKMGGNTPMTRHGMHCVNRSWGGISTWTSKSLSNIKCTIICPMILTFADLTHRYACSENEITNSKNISSRISLKCDSNRIKNTKIGTSICKWVFLPLIFR